MTSEIGSHSLFFELQNFEIKSLFIRSEVLKGNYLGDPSERRHALLIPKSKAPTSGWAVIWHLSGLGSNGPRALNYQPLEPNWPQRIDRGVSKGRWPAAVHVFVDAVTSLGGSQFINSAWTGRYEDHLLQEALPALRRYLGTELSSAQVLVTGGSSGGYGALHLGSLHPDHFPYVAASAPDSAFEASLLPDLFAASSEVARWGDVPGAIEAFRGGKIKRNSNYFKILNALAMATCYSSAEDPAPSLPLDLHTGVLREEVWRRWKSHDPVEFIPRRIEGMRRLKGLYLDVGTSDQFFLYFGCRQLDNCLKNSHITYTYREFQGGHFDLDERRPEILDWFFEQVGKT